jgi:hypothetical protein
MYSSRSADCGGMCSLAVVASIKEKLTCMLFCLSFDTSQLATVLASCTTRSDGIAWCIGRVVSMAAAMPSAYPIKTACLIFIMAGCCSMR